MTSRKPNAFTLVQALSSIAVVAVFTGLWLFIQEIDPIPFYSYKYDPEMPYMLNSLGIFKSEPYAYIDHPGTPVEIIGTIILAIVRIFKQINSDTFWMDILKNPSSFLTITYGFLTLGSTITVLFFSKRAIRLKNQGDIIPSLAIGLAFFALLPGLSFNTLFYWSHNSFNFLAGSLLLLFTYIKLRSGNRLQLLEVVLFGAAAGVLTAVQLYFLTWIVGITLAFMLYEFFQTRKIRQTLAVVFASSFGAFSGFFIATLPIIHKYREFSWWVKSLVMHQGRYGRGPSGITSFNTLIENIKELFQSDGILFVSCLITVLLLAYAMSKNRRQLHDEAGWWATAIGLSIQLFLAIFLVAKHPGRIYLLSIAAILPLLLSLAFEVMGNLGGRIKYLRTGISVVILFGFVLSLISTIDHHNQLNASIRSEENELERIKASYAVDSGVDPDSLTILWGYGTSSHCFALRFGNVYADNSFGNEIDELCPNDWIYDIYSDLAVIHGEAVALEDSNEWDILVMVNNKKSLPDNADKLGQLIISEGGGQAYILARIMD